MKKNKDVPDGYYISRLTGELLPKDNKTINEMVKSGEEFDEETKMAIKGFGELLSNKEYNNTNSLKYLYREWSFPKKIIDIVFNEFGNSFDESDSFLNRMDGCDGTIEEKMKEAWDDYCEECDISTGPRTDDFSDIIYG
jgi:hypothetical protein